MGGRNGNALANITKLEGLKSWKNGRKAPYQGVVKRDWVPTGRIDFATNLNGNDARTNQMSLGCSLKNKELSKALLEMKILKFNAGRHAKEAKAVVTQYHKYLKENSLIKSIFEPDILPPDLEQRFVKHGNKGQH